ncbi:MAG TPA: hypothetical protein VNI54_01975 [Thermoanaerobaculia bacterium]|nr:hypothetical protein [Thermoanaerobaculia bacterium]
MKTAVVAALVFACAAFAADSPLDREIARLEETLNAVKPDDVPADARGLFDAHRTALERARRATPEEYRLYRLRDAFVGIETLAFLARHKDAHESLDAFTKLWEKSRARFDVREKLPAGTLVERGLSESAATRAERLFDASLPYARASKPWSGVYYLGEAEANLRFRDFVESIANAEVQEGPPSRRRVAAMLDQLEQLTLKVFGADVTNQNLVPVSVRLKEARELLAAGRVAGAVLLAIEARAALSRRGGPGGTYPEVAKHEGSIAALVEGWAKDEEAPMNVALRTEVAPFFDAMYAGEAKPRSAPKTARVKVTLVRWPYT